MEADAADINADRHIDGLRNPARLPAITVDFSPVPSTTNPLGAKVWAKAALSSQPRQ
jgi:hypothetical protein